jgi:hypothetical protein
MTIIGAAHTGRIVRRTSDCLRWSIIVALMAGPLLGCDRETDSNPKSNDEASEPPAEAGQRLPAYYIASGLRAAYPEVVAFIEEFLNTCLVGDYAGYRRLVSRAHTPESRERFEAIYQATEAVTVESIKPIDIPRIPPPVYLAVSAVELNPQQQMKLRETHRKVAILVFKEDAEWRMAPAPADLQPKDEPPAAPTSAPTTSAPAYPWDKDGDY